MPDLAIKKKTFNRFIITFKVISMFDLYLFS